MSREHTFIAVRKPRCRVPHCTRDSVSRGVCRSCYQSAYLLIKAGEVSWSQLEDGGKVDRTERVETARNWFLNLTSK